jgi:hypothetical protein
MSKNKQLAGALGDYDGVDFFGLDEFGAPAGNVYWGAGAGALAQTGTAMAVRRWAPGKARYSEGIGALVGVGGAALTGWLMPGMRSAAWAAGVVAAVSGGLRQLEVSLLSAPMMGMASMERGYPVGLGMATMEPGYPVGLQGAPTQLLGADRQSQLLGMGGPNVSGLASAYGATLFGN